MIAAMAILASGVPAGAHPHILVTARAELVFDDQGRLSSVRHIWQFDEAWSAFAVQGLDTNRDDILTVDELAPLAQVNMESLVDYEYFTWLTVDGERRALAAPREYWLDIYGTSLTLFYTLPLAVPAAVGGEARLEVYDPEYYVAFDFDPSAPIALVDAPAGCTGGYRPPAVLDAQTAIQLALIPADQRELPPELAAVTEDLANAITVACR